MLAIAIVTILLSGVIAVGSVAIFAGGEEWLDAPLWLRRAILFLSFPCGIFLLGLFTMIGLAASAMGGELGMAWQETKDEWSFAWEDLKEAWNG